MVLLVLMLATSVGIVLVALDESTLFWPTFPGKMLRVLVVMVSVICFPFSTTVSINALTPFVLVGVGGSGRTKIPPGAPSVLFWKGHQRLVFIHDGACPFAHCGPYLYATYVETTLVIATPIHHCVSDMPCVVIYLRSAAASTRRERS